MCGVCCALCVVRCALCVVRCALCVVRCAMCIVFRFSFVVYRASCVVHRMSCVVHRASCVFPVIRACSVASIYVVFFPVSEPPINRNAIKTAFVNGARMSVQSKMRLRMRRMMSIGMSKTGWVFDL